MTEVVDILRQKPVYIPGGTIVLKADVLTEAQRYYARNREACKARKTKWRLENPDKIRAINKKYTKKNRKKVNAWSNARYHNNPEYRATAIAASAARHARLRQEKLAASLKPETGVKA